MRLNLALPHLLELNPPFFFFQIPPVLLLLNLSYLFAFLLDDELLIEVLPVVPDLLMPQLNLSVFFLIDHVGLLLNHSRPLIYFTVGVQREISLRRVQTNLTYIIP